MGAITEEQRVLFEDLATHSDEGKAVILAAVLETLEGCLKGDGKRFNARIVREARGLLSRLTGPLTLDECRDVLNENQYLYSVRPEADCTWVKSLGGRCETLFNGFDSLTLFEAAAIARAFLMQGGAA